MAARSDGGREPARLRLARAVCSRTQPYGSGKLRRLLYSYERAKADGYQFTVRAKTGSPFTGSTEDFHAYPMGVHGYSEWRNWAVALALCDPGDLIVEVGANVGTETVGFSDIVGEDGKVVAFEPLPSNLATLQAVAPLFRYPNVSLLPYALADRPGLARFAQPPPSMSQGIGHLITEDETETGTTTYYGEPVEMAELEVERRTLDQFADRLRDMRLLVADAEGAEVSILRGGHRVLSAERPALVLEASRPHLRRAGQGREELHAELKALGYTAYLIKSLDVREVVEPDAGGPSPNWLCLTDEDLDHGSLERVRGSLRRCALTPCVLGLNPLSRPARRRAERDIPA